MRKIKTIALFMIILIISLPIYSANVFGLLTIQSYGGQDQASSGTTGYRGASNDITKAVFSSDVADVRCSCNPNNPLSCTGSGTNYQCTYLDTSSMQPGTVMYTYYQFDGSSPVGAPVSTTLVVDGKAPSVASFSVSSSNSKLNIDFIATDSISDTDQTKCSGVKTVNAYVDGVKKGAYNGSTNLGGCSLSGSVVVNGVSDGYHDIYLEAIDYVSNIGASEVKTLFFDLTPPQLTDAYLTRGGDRLHFYSNAALIGVKFYATLYEHNLSATSVWADLSELTINPAKKPQLTHVSLSCELAGIDTYECSATLPAEIIFDASGSADVSVYGEDLVGNSGTNEFTISLTLDESKPYSDFIGTNYCNNADNCYLRPGSNQVIAKIYDNGAGVSSGQVYLKAETLGLSTATKVKSCDQVSGIWQCSIYINAKAADGSNHVVSLVYPSQDDVGNELESFSSNLTIDASDPVINDIKVMKRGSTEEYIAALDKMRLELYAYDKNSGISTAYADLSQIVPGLGDGVEASSCIYDAEMGEGYYLCTWLTESVTGTAGNYNVKFTATDFAGNDVSETKQIPVYGRTDQNITFWKVSNVRTDPGILDRVTSQYVPGMLNLWANVGLVAAQNVKLLSADIVGECTGIGHNYLLDSKLYPIVPASIESNSGSVTLVMELRKEAPLPDNADNLRFACPVVLTSAIGTTLYPSEILDVDIVVDLYTSGYDLPNDYAQRIKGFKDALKDTEWIDSVEGFINIAQKLCTVLKLVNKLLGVISIIKALISAGLKTNPFTYAAGEAEEWLSKGIFVTKIGLVDKTASWVCGMADCTLLDKLMGGDYGWYAKFINVYTTTLTSNFGQKMASRNENTNNLAIADTWNDESRNLFPSDGKEFSLGDQLNKLGEDSSNVLEASKQSIFVSAISLCIPGILYNLKKARNIDCMYVDCAERWTSAGFNPYTCEAMRANAYCNFVYGQIFHLIPFTGLVDFVGNAIQIFSSNPIAAAGMAFGVVCMMTKSDGGLLDLCMTVENVKTVVNFFQGIFQDFQFIAGDGQTDFCERVLNDDEQKANNG